MRALEFTQHRRLTLCIFGLFFSLLSQPVLAEMTIRVWDKNMAVPHDRVFLELAVAKAEAKYGPITLIASKPLSQTQAFAELMIQSGEIDLAVAGVSSEREKELLPIYLPIDRGLLGFRLCLIKATAQASFNNVQVANDFGIANLAIAVGQAWPDKQVMQANQLPVVTADTLQGLVQQVQKDRASCVTRSVTEVLDDALQFPDLTPESHLLMIYPLANLPFISPNRADVHAVIQYGLEQAIADGSFQDLFNATYSSLMGTLSVYSRKLVFLSNPDMSERARDAINQHGIASFAATLNQ